MPQYGDELLQRPLPKADKAAISCGVDVRSARRARALVLDAMCNDSEKSLQLRAESEFHGKPIARGYKFSWDEMALRFYVTQDCSRLFFVFLKVESNDDRISIGNLKEIESNDDRIRNPTDVESNDDSSFDSTSVGFQNK